MPVCVARREGRQTELPLAARQESLCRNVRATCCFCSTTVGACCSRRRPPSGLWGGLVCPEARSANHPKALLSATAVACSAITGPAAGRHAFTPFPSDHPRCVATSPAAVVNSASGCDGCLERIASAALPTPIRRLLRLSACAGCLFPHDAVVDTLAVSSTAQCRPANQRHKANDQPRRFVATKSVERHAKRHRPDESPASRSKNRKRRTAHLAHRFR